jgi:hypothetical protein
MSELVYSLPFYKQIKCLMDNNNGEPPCRRCVERGLSCVLNKSLQTLISERSQWKDDMHRDISTVHGAVQDILKRLSMPAMQPLKAPIMEAEDAQETSPFEDASLLVVEKTEDVGPSCDNSPKLPPQPESMQSVPIDSLYQITRLRSLRAENSRDDAKADPATDVVSKGIVSIEEAERLTTLYLGRLDHYAYSIANKFTSLQAIRRRSVALTNAILTVAALHDANSNQLFGPCCREFKRLLSDSMFDRRIDREYLRAMCIGSYWLSDISYTLCGHAIRRAMAINLSSNYHRVLNEGSEDAADCLRLWYLLYICDQHLSILYGRPTTIRLDDPSLQGWERYLEVRVAVEQDRRTASQVAILVIMGTVREFFERNNTSSSRDTQTLPQNLTDQIATFDRQIDHWVDTWYTHLSTFFFLLFFFPFFLFSFSFLLLFFFFLSFFFLFLFFVFFFFLFFPFFAQILPNNLHNRTPQQRHRRLALQRRPPTLQPRTPPPALAHFPRLVIILLVLSQNPSSLSLFSSKGNSSRHFNRRDFIVGCGHAGWIGGYAALSAHDDCICVWLFIAG